MYGYMYIRKQPRNENRESEKAMNTTCASEFEQKVLDTSFFLQDAVRFCRHQLDRANRIMDSGNTYRSADALENAIGAEKAAMRLHDELSALFNDGEMRIDGETFEAFCEAETLRAALTKACQRRHDLIAATR